jgi:hypothetical protein
MKKVIIITQMKFIGNLDIRIGYESRRLPEQRPIKGIERTRKFNKTYGIRNSGCQQRPLECSNLVPKRFGADQIKTIRT